MFKKTLKIIPLGGTGEVTKNMYVYEYGNDQLLVDCGIGFPDESTPGVDFSIPDISYLEKSKKNIRGLIITHGHMDHFGGLPYILPRLPKISVFGSTLTMALAEARVREFDIKTRFQVAEKHLNLGPFDIDLIHMTHSTPNCKHLLIKTPAATVYHGADFKFDLSPLDNKPADFAAISQAGSHGIDLLLTDCLGIDKPGSTPSEKTLLSTIEDEVRKTQGKFIFSTISSSISRIEMAIQAAARYNRKVALAGFSIEKNVTTAAQHGFINIPKNTLIKTNKINSLPPNKVAIIIAGSQGQEGSALHRLAAGEHRSLKLSPRDHVVISSSVIPGTESSVFGLVDTLFKRGVTVSYPGITNNLHVTGHGYRNDLALMVRLTRPRHIMPIGGDIRHMYLYRQMVTELGYHFKQVHLLDAGQVLEVSHDQVQVAGKIDSKNVYVDGLGIGDVGQVVLRDRQTMSQDGILLAIVPVSSKSSQIRGEIEIISRGFIYMKESKTLITQTKQQIKKVLSGKSTPLTDPSFVREKIEKTLSQFLYKQTERRPLIVTLLLEV